MGTQRFANESCGIVEVKNAMVLLPQSSSTNTVHQKPSIEPPTPDYKRENGEKTDKLLSPTVSVFFPPIGQCSDSNLINGYPSPSDDDSLTPKECIFDPFVPGPDKFMLAPLRKKYTEESRPSAVRQLSFPLAINLVTHVSHKSGLETNTDENDLFESLYHNILDAIVSEQSKEFGDGVLTEVLDSGSDSDVFKTPKSAPHLSWIAETCPRAPVKSSSKFRNIDKELCRKLEY